MFRKSLVAALVVLLAPAVGSAQTRTDAQIYNDVSREITTCPRFTVFDDIGVFVEAGVVTLSGKVTMPVKRGEIERRVTGVPGVREVVNRIGVLPVSHFDNQLRLQIARAIYGNPTFWQYGSMPNPPIHIIVEHGHVTLTGVVNSNVERVLARSLASSFNAFRVTDQLRTEAEVRAGLERINSPW